MLASADDFKIQNWMAEINLSGYIPPTLRGRGVRGRQFHLFSLPHKGKIKPQMEFQGSPFQGSPPSPNSIFEGVGIWVSSILDKQGRLTVAFCEAAPW